MPQMSPLSWTLIFLGLLFFLMMNLSNLQTINLNVKNKTCLNKKEKKMLW